MVCNLHEIRYNPYKAAYFYEYENNRIVECANYVILNEYGWVFAIGLKGKLNNAISI